MLLTVGFRVPTFIISHVSYFKLFVNMLVRLFGNKAMLCMLCFYFTRVLTCPRHSVESAINECIWFRLLASISLSMTHSFSILRTHVLSKAFLYSCSSIIILLSRSSLVIEPVGMFVKSKKSFIFFFLMAYTVIKFSTSVHFEADL